MRLLSEFMSDTYYHIYFSLSRDEDGILCFWFTSLTKVEKNKSHSIQIKIDKTQLRIS